MAVFLLVVMAGCGKTTYRLIYNNIGFFITYKINQYTPLTSEQRSFLNNRIQYHLEWHRTNKLAEYQVFLQKIREKIQNGLTLDDLNWSIQWYHQEEKAMVTRFADDIVEFLSSLSDEQVAQLRKKLEDQTRSMEEKLNNDPESRHEERTEFMVKMIKLLHGDLSDGQKDEINTLTADMIDVTSGKFIIRKIIINEFMSLIGKSADKAILKETIFKWTTDYMDYISEADRNNIRTLQDQYNQVLLTIDKKIITPKQREHALKKIDEFIDILQYVQKG